MKIVIGVAREGERREAGFLHGDADLLVQLADQGCFRPLAGFDLAAGKFPQARHHLSLRPLRDQDALVGVDERAGDHEDDVDGNHVPEP